jgi:hypothetical protein
LSKEARLRSLQKKLFRIADRLRELRSEEALMTEELSFHRHLHDDARRDAAVTGHPLDREDETETRADVVRFERELERLRVERERLLAKRSRLLERLDDV